MSSEFEKLKSGRIEAFNRLKASIQPTLGSHKTTRLSQAGCRETSSLLRDEVSSKHARMFSNDLNAFCGPVDSRSQDDFRFLTILHSVTPLDCDDTLMQASKLKQNLQVLHVFSQDNFTEKLMMNIKTSQPEPSFIGDATIQHSTQRYGLG